MKGTESDPVREAVPQQGGTVAVRCDDTVLKAATAMQENGVGATVVTDDDSRVIGILTERDLLGLLASEAVDPRGALVGSVMVPDPASCRMETSVGEARELMMSRRIRHLPVVDENGAAVGMLSSRDVLAHQITNDRAMRSAAEQIAMLTTWLKSLNFDEVVNLVTNQVPEIFRAGRSVLFFPPEGDEGKEFLLISRNNCPCPNERLPSREELAPTSEDGAIHFGEVPCACKAVGATSPSLVVSLEVAGLGGDRSRGEGPSRGHLCMCALSRDAAGAR